jgi:ABC-type uncharacterized transport system substrate-binding protein
MRRIALAVVLTRRQSDSRQPSPFPALATELVRLKVDLIVARGTPAILAAKSATSTIPVITSASAIPWRRASSPVSRAREGM